MTRRHSCFALLLVTWFIPAAWPQDDDPAAKADKETEASFKSIKYRLIGPMAGGRVSRARGVPGDPRTVYVGTASGGVWKSNDGGVAWEPIFDDQPTASIGALAVAPSDPNVVYVGSGEANIRGNVAPGNGIYVSTNGGKKWKHVWKEEKCQIGQIAVDPKNADIAFAAVLGSAFGPSAKRGIYRTTDGGKTWKAVLEKDVNTGGIDVAINPANPRVVWAALWQARRTPWSLTSGGPGSGLFRSDDGGDTWKELGPNAKDADDKDDDEKLPPGPWGRVGIAVAPSSPDRVYVLIEAEKGGLYRTDDGGATWELVNKGRYLRSRPWYFSTLTVDPANADNVWVCNVRLLKSGDGGKSFANVVGPHHVDHHDLWIDPKDSSRIIDSHDGGVDLSKDGGATWHMPFLPICQFYHISTDTRVPYRVLGNMQDQGTASGPSNSLSSAGISLSDWHTVGGGETGFSFADPRDPNIVYAGEYAGILTRYDHRTRQANNIGIYPLNASGKGAGDLRYRFNWTAPILLSPHNPDVVYHAGNLLFRTKDQGRTWDKISPDLTRNDKSKLPWTGGPITGDNTGAEYYCTIFALAESPKQPGLLWVGTDDGLVHLSKDDGKSWSNVTPKIPGLPEWGTVACIEPSRHDAGAAYVVVDAHRLDDNRPYLWKTADFGQTWLKLSDTLPQNDYLRVIREDPDLRNVLYLGTEHTLRLSRDGGASWSRLKLNLPTVAVSDLAIANGDLVVGTNGRSIYILDDLAPFKTWSPKMAEGPALLPIRPAIRWRHHGEGYHLEDRMPGNNPPNGAIINYYLAKAPKDDITLEIFDSKNRIVQRLTSKPQSAEYKETDPDPPWSIFKPTVLAKKPGLQRTTWDLTYSGPKIIPSAKNDGGIPYRGPPVLPGVYTVKLTVDGAEFTQQLEVKLDPRVKANPVDLEAAHQLALEIRADVWRLSEIVVGLRALRGQLVQRQEIWKDDAKAKDQVKLAHDLEQQLDRLEAQLHNPDAEIFYDILARKGGAKLYSQFGLLYDYVKGSDGPVTQGMREVYADYAAEFKKREQEWTKIVNEDLPRFNARTRDLSLPSVAVPRPGEIPRGLLMKRRS